MIPVSEAIRIIKEQTPLLQAETVPLVEARQRFLAENIEADSDLPPFNRSQMDGYALRAADVRQAPATLRIVGESAAGRGWHQQLSEGEAVRIMTGAPVPEGADSVQQVELTREIEDGTAVEILEAVSPGRSVVSRGSEIKQGERVLGVGEVINAGAVAVLASFGYASVKVSRRPRVAVLATGSELVDIDQKPGQDQIRDSNNYSIAAYASLSGATINQLPLAGDDTKLLVRQIDEASGDSDIVVSSGGVSVGAYDFTKPALRELGAEIFFERVALRPGKPIVFARLPGGALFFGLPGNPVSVAVTFNLFARTSILKMQGANRTELARDTATLLKGVKPNAERESYLPAELTTDPGGRMMAHALKWGGSSDFISFARANALIVVPMGPQPLEAGAIVQVLHLPR